MHCSLDDQKMELPEKCLRNREDCEPRAQIASDNGKSFICCGRNDGTGRTVDQDCFTVCWKNGEIDTRDNWDRRDITDTASVLIQALSVEENLNT